jgi:hypothetical protein
MMRLWYAFLELPSWEGIAIITGAVMGLMAVALLCLRAGYVLGVIAGSEPADDEP